MPLNDVISLNVGGVSMATTRATLLSDPKSSLARMFQEDSEIPPAKIKDGEFFLDLDPKCFEVLLEPVSSQAQANRIFTQVVLTWLRHRQLVLPSTVSQEGVAVLADFLCLEELLALVKPPPKPPPSPLDSTLSRLSMVKLCEQGEPISHQLLDPGWRWVCTNKTSGSLAVPYFKLGPLLEDNHGSRTDIRLRGSDLILGMDTSLGPKLCLTSGSDSNIWANRYGLALHLHQLEYVTWVQCDSNTVPSSALEFSKTQSNLPRYLGFAVEDNQNLPGVVVKGKNIRLLGRDYGPKSDKFYVLTTGKNWDL